MTTGNARYYAQLLRAFWGNDQTAADVSALLNRDPSITRIVLNRMNALRLVHVTGWQHRVGKTVTRIYGFGDGVDMPQPMKWNGQPRKRKPSSAPLGVSLITFKVLIDALSERSTLRDLEEATGLACGTVSRQIAYMRSIRLVYIAGWTRESNAGKPTRMFRLGVMKSDAARPHRRNAAELQRGYALRKRERDQYQGLMQAINANTFQQAA